MNKRLILVPLLILALIHVLLILRYAANAPYWDDYNAILQYVNEYKTADSWNSRVVMLFKQHNEHRVFLDRIVALLDVWIFNKINFKHFIYVGNVFLLLTYFLIAKISLPILEKSKLTTKWILLLPIPFLLLNLQSWENFLWAMASVQNIGVIFFSLLTFYLLFSTALNARNFGLAVLAAALATYSSGNGMLSLIVGLGVLAGSNAKRVYVYLWAFFSVVIIFSYFKGYHSISGHPDPVNTLLYQTNLLISHFFVLLGNGWAFYRFEMAFSIFAGFGLLLTFLYLLQRGIYTDTLIFSILTFLFLSCCLTSLSRAGFGADQAISIRYRIYSHLIAIFIYLGCISRLHTYENAKKLAFFCFCFVFLSFVNYSYSFVKYGSSLHEGKQSRQHGLVAFKENNRISYLAYPDQQTAKQILKVSDSLGTFNVPLNYLSIASPRVSYAIGDDTDAINYDFDVEQKKDVLMIDNGWAYIKGYDTDNCQKMVVLKSGNDELLYGTYSHLRGDVTAAMNAGNLDNSGFSVIVPISEIPDGKYRVGIFIIKRKNFVFVKRKAFTLTNKVVVKAGDSIRTSTEELPRPVAAENLKPQYYVDEVKVLSDSVMVRGWALLEGVDMEKVKKNLSFKLASGEVLEAIPRTEIRPDVSNALSGPYHDSGFRISLPIEFFKSSNSKMSIELQYAGITKSIETGKEIILKK